MKNRSGAMSLKNIRNIQFLLSGITMNVIAAYIARRTGLPVFLDTIGTVFVAASMGLFPGIAAAVATNTICLFFNCELCKKVTLNTVKGSKRS